MLKDSGGIRFPLGRATDKPPRAAIVGVMHSRLHLTGYGQRCQVETVFSMIDQRLGSAVNARSYWSQCRGLMLKALVHNTLILWHRFRGPLQSKAGLVLPAR